MIKWNIMEDENKSQGPNISSRRSRLEAQKAEQRSEIPSYLKAVTGAQTARAFEQMERQAPEQPTPTNETSNHEITIKMSKTSLFSVFLAAAFTGVMCFIAGMFFTAYTASKPEPIATQTSETKTTPAPLPKAADTQSGQAGDLTTLAQNINQQYEVTEDVPELPLKETPVGDAVDSASQVKDVAAPLADEVNRAKGVVDALLPKAEQKTNQHFFTINLGEARTIEQAELMKAELSKVGVETFVAKETEDDGRDIYFVRIGKFETYDMASKAQLELPKPYSIWGKIAQNKTDEAA